MDEFRFHTGSIKSNRVSHRWCSTRSCFDSILVRLKVDNPSVFHVQGIGTFRFHTGSIKSKHLFPVGYGYFRFDSILVRLKDVDSRHVLLPLLGFRFHTGSIKSSHLTSNCIGNLCFDSILVRLKVDLVHGCDADSVCFDSILVRLKARRRL